MIGIHVGDDYCSEMHMIHPFFDPLSCITSSASNLVVAERRAQDLGTRDT